jgi:hypothetical protein
MTTMKPVLEVRIERLISAPPSSVYQAWLQPELLRRWLAPGSMETSALSSVGVSLARNEPKAQRSTHCSPSRYGRLPVTRPPLRLCMSDWMIWSGPCRTWLEMSGAVGNWCSISWRSSSIWRKGNADSSALSLRKGSGLRRVRVQARFAISTPPPKSESLQSLATILKSMVFLLIERLRGAYKPNPLFVDGIPAVTPRVLAQSERNALREGE